MGRLGLVSGGEGGGRVAHRKVAGHQRGSGPGPRQTDVSKRKKNWRRTSSERPESHLPDWRVQGSGGCRTRDRCVGQISPLCLLKVSGSDFSPGHV